jgi:DNA-binding response OmpR family regulator
VQKTQKNHILLIDDDALSLAMLSDYLAEASFEVTSIETGHDALILLQKFPSRFDAIIVDRVMPKLSGIDFLHKLYVNPKLNHIPIIMLTAHAEREDVGAAIIAGVFDFLYKPIDKELLLLVLKRALNVGAGSKSVLTGKKTCVVA